MKKIKTTRCTNQTFKKITGLEAEKTLMTGADLEIELKKFGWVVDTSFATDSATVKEAKYSGKYDRGVYLMFSKNHVMVQKNGILFDCAEKGYRTKLVINRIKKLID